MTESNDSTKIKLDDPLIRVSLKRYLDARSPKPRMLIEELGVFNGRAIADVVALYSHSHCYEIKSDKDRVERVLKQLEHYDKTFSRMTLVTTEKFLPRAHRILPEYWGILIAVPNKSQIRFHHHRAARHNPHWDAEKALLSLWKSELLKIGTNLQCQIKEKYNRTLLAQVISDESHLAAVRDEYHRALFERYTEKLSA